MKKWSERFNYKTLNIFTYLMYDGKYFKIGKTRNIKKRLLSIKTNNPDIKLLCLADYDCENYLHSKYKKYRHKGEWFLFKKEDALDFSRLWLEFTLYDYNFPLNLKKYLISIYGDDILDKIINGEEITK